MIGQAAHQNQSSAVSQLCADPSHGVFTLYQLTSMVKYKRLIGKNLGWMCFLGHQRYDNLQAYKQQWSRKMHYPRASSWRDCACKKASSLAWRFVNSKSRREWLCCHFQDQFLETTDTHCRELGRWDVFSQVGWEVETTNQIPNQALKTCLLQREESLMWARFQWLLVRNSDSLEWNRLVLRYRT